MQNYCKYQSPIGEILLAADGENLVGLWFVDSKYCPDVPLPERYACTKILSQAIEWLECYFQGNEPNFTPLIKLFGTKFQLAVWKILCAIPYGQTTTYGNIAKQLALQFGVPRVSAQAVGQAVGHNPISVIVPCHRVVGANGTLTGYAGGVDKKTFLLNLERIY